MNQFPLFAPWLKLMAEFNAANVLVATIAVIVVGWLAILNLRYPRLMAATRSLLSYSFFIVALIMLVASL